MFSKIWSVLPDKGMTSATLHFSPNTVICAVDSMPSVHFHYCAIACLPGIGKLMDLCFYVYMSIYACFKCTVCIELLKQAFISTPELSEEDGCKPLSIKALSDLTQSWLVGNLADRNFMDQ